MLRTLSLDCTMTAMTTATLTPAAARHSLVDNVLAVLTGAAVSRREYANAMALIEEHMPLVKALGDKRGTATLLHTSAQALRGLGDYEGCLEHFSNSLTLAEEVGDELRNVERLVRSHQRINGCGELDQAANQDAVAVD